MRISDWSSDVCSSDLGRTNLPILIDQEGGRVARMKSPEWPDFPSGAAFDALYERAPASAIEAARLNAMALATMLAEVGITVDCLPLLDVRQPGASDVIGDRALGSEPIRSEEHTSELPSLIPLSFSVFCLKKK